MKRKNDAYRMKRRSFKKRLGRKLIALGLILAGIFIIIDMRVRPIIERTSTYQCQVLAARIINETLYNELGDDYDYGSLVKLTADESGNIASIESDMYNINRLKTHSSLLINEAIQKIPAHQLNISLGTVSGINMLFGTGPDLPVRIAPRGYANAVLVSKFTSAGINQTLHQIIMEITADITVIIPGYTKTVMVTTDFLVAETVIIGNVPDSYTHIISGNADLINKASDYNAENYNE